MLMNRDKEMSELPGNNQWPHFHHFTDFAHFYSSQFR